MIENGPKWRRRRRLTRDDEDPEGATEGRKDGRAPLNMLPLLPPPLDNRILPTFLCVRLRRRQRYLFAPRVRHRHGVGRHVSNFDHCSLQPGLPLRLPTSSLLGLMVLLECHENTLSTNPICLTMCLSRVLHTCFTSFMGRGWEWPPILCSPARA